MIEKPFTDEGPGIYGFDPDYMPGGSAVKRQGCLCPVLDNRYGEGVIVEGEYQWYIQPGCPIHAIKPEESSESGRE